MTAPLRIDIPLLPQASIGNALQFIDLVRSANLLARLREGGRAPALAWQLLDATGRPLRTDDAPAWLAGSVSGGAAESRPFAVFLPSLQVPDVPSLQRAVEDHLPIVRALGQVVDAGGVVATSGSAAWLAARTGRLDAQRCALPWYLVPAFRRAFPAIAVAESTAFDGGAWCSAATLHGLPALVAMLVRRAMGEAMARVCSRAFEPDAARTRAAAIAHAQVPVTRAGVLARAIDWMEERLEQPYSLEEVAAAAAVSPRTLLRHFRQAFGRSPLDYLHRLRCERAQVLLEITLESVPSIAAACGYRDPTAFRRVFHRHCGTTPAAWREQHALRAPRARWRVDVQRLATR